LTARSPGWYGVRWSASPRAPSWPVAPCFSPGKAGSTWVFCCRRPTGGRTGCRSRRRRTAAGQSPGGGITSLTRHRRSVSPASRRSCCCRSLRPRRERMLVPMDTGRSTTTTSAARTSASRSLPALAPVSNSSAVSPSCGRMAWTCTWTRCRTSETGERLRLPVPRRQRNAQHRTLLEGQGLLLPERAAGPHCGPG
jgi:hypothetical protein